MPAPPNPIEKINFIIKFLVDPCDAPLTVYARWAWPALLDLLLDYFTFQPDEIIIQSFRTRTAPLRQRSGRKGGRGSKASRSRFRKKLGQIVDFDPNEQLGKKLGKATKLAWRAKGPTSALWLLHGILQRLFFYLFLAELLTDFFYNWFSLMTAHGYCQAQGDDVLLAEGPTQLPLAIVEKNAIGMSSILKIRGKVAWNTFAGSFTGDQATLVVSGNFRTQNIAFPDPRPQLWVQVQYGSRSYDYKLADIQLHGLDVEPAQGEIVLNGPCTFAPYVTYADGSVGNAYIEQPCIYLHGTSTHASV